MRYHYFDWNLGRYLVFGNQINGYTFHKQQHFQASLIKFEVDERLPLQVALNRPDQLQATLGILKEIMLETIQNGPWNIKMYDNVDINVLKIIVLKKHLFLPSNYQLSLQNFVLSLELFSGCSFQPSRRDQRQS